MIIASQNNDPRDSTVRYRNHDFFDEYDVNAHIDEIKKIVLGEETLKEKIKNENLNKRNILLLNPEYDQNVLTFYDLKKMIDNGKELIANGTKTEGVPLESTVADLEAAYND